MKPSEAMRRGIAATRGQSFTQRYDKKSDTCCALGALYLGLEDAIPHSPEERHCLIYRPPTEEIRNIAEEASATYFQNYHKEIINDNDFNRLTLEEIADRLEAIGL